MERKQHYSQLGQDRWISSLFRKKRNGFFVDVGAHDGEKLSNTAFLERELAWMGICIEPTPEIFQRLCKNRGCTCVQAAISDSPGILDFVIHDEKKSLLNHVRGAGQGGRRSTSQEISVEAQPLEQVLEASAPASIDYLSVDVEGMELQVLRSIDYSKYIFGVLTVEHNFEMPKREQIRELLTKNGFVRVRRNRFEDWYMNTRVFSRQRIYREAGWWSGRQLYSVVKRRLLRLLPMAR